MKIPLTLTAVAATVSLCFAVSGYAQPASEGSTAAASVPSARELRHPSQEDKALIRTVRRRLARTPGLDPANISVLAHNGVVVLTGSVVSQEQSTLAVSAASQVPNVRNVVDKMTIRAPM
jgi:osmotically-inducible protein OsmY